MRSARSGSARPRNRRRSRWTAWKPPKEITTAWDRLMPGEGLAGPCKDIDLPGLTEEFLFDAAKAFTEETVHWYPNLDELRREE